jgi:hypothetical protein
LQVYKNRDRNELGRPLNATGALDTEAHAAELEITKAAVRPWLEELKRLDRWDEMNALTVGQVPCEGREYLQDWVSGPGLR